MSSGPAAGQNLKKLGSLLGVDPFDNSLSVQEIFGNLSGSLLLDAIFQTYQIGDNKTRVRFFLDENSTDDTAVPFASRQVGIVRHAFNQRRHAGVKQAYIKSCMARGIVEGVRGECWIGEPKPDALGVRKGPYQALTYGSLLESFYTALNMEPGNPLLIRTLQRGFGVSTLFTQSSRECGQIHGQTPQSIPSGCWRFVHRADTNSSRCFLAHQLLMLCDTMRYTTLQHYITFTFTFTFTLQYITLYTYHYIYIKLQGWLLDWPTLKSDQWPVTMTSYVVSQVEFGLAKFKKDNGITWSTKGYETKCASTELGFLV